MSSAANSKKILKLSATIVNIGDKDIINPMLQFTLYDKDGNELAIREAYFEAYRRPGTHTNPDKRKEALNFTSDIMPGQARTATTSFYDPESVAKCLVILSSNGYLINISGS